jgi:hypothetical protein
MEVFHDRVGEPSGGGEVSRRRVSLAFDISAVFLERKTGDPDSLSRPLLDRLRGGC